MPPYYWKVRKIFYAPCYSLFFPHLVNQVQTTHTKNNLLWMHILTLYFCKCRQQLWRKLQPRSNFLSVQPHRRGQAWIQHVWLTLFSSPLPWSRLGSHNTAAATIRSPQVWCVIAVLPLAELTSCLSAFNSVGNNIQICWSRLSCSSHLPPIPNATDNTTASARYVDKPFLCLLWFLWFVALRCVVSKGVYMYDVMLCQQVNFSCCYMH